MKNLEKIKTLLNLTFLFSKIGSMTFGGGYAMMPMFQKELVEKRKWITDEELLDYYAIGQSTPGIVAINVSTFIGYKQMGVIGGIFATIGMVIPSLVIIMVLAKLIDSVNDFPVVQKALKGVNVAVAALLTKVSLTFAKKTIRNVFSAFMAVAAFSLMYFFKIQSFFIMTGTIVLGLIIYFSQNPIKRMKEKRAQMKNKSGAEEPSLFEEKTECAKDEADSEFAEKTEPAQRKEISESTEIAEDSEDSEGGNS